MRGASSRSAGAKRSISCPSAVTTAVRAPADLLDAPRTYSYNGVTLTVAAEDGNGLRVSSSDCPTQDCVRTGTISRSGQSIMCLPARIIIQLTGGAADSNDVDIVIG